jgi:hypothetical protein
LCTNSNATANVPLCDRIAGLQTDVAKVGLPDPDFGTKKFTDEMWED